MTSVKVTTGWCTNCGDSTVAGDGTCTRCRALAILAPTESTIDGELFRDADVETVRRLANSPQVALPGSKQTERWLSDTRALVDGYRAQRAEAEATVKREEERIASLDAAIGGLLLVLERFGLHHVEPARTQGLAHLDHGARLGDARARRRWARTRDGQTYQACRDCGRSDVKHQARGLCATCYIKAQAGSKSAVGA